MTKAELAQLFAGAKWDEASELLRQAVADLPADSNAPHWHWALLAVHAGRSGKHWLALRFAKRAASSTPDRPADQNGIAVALRLLGLDGAAPHLTDKVG